MMTHYYLTDQSP